MNEYPVLYLFGSMAAVFVALLGWIGTRLIHRMDDLTHLLQNDLKELMHQHDLRITALENWRDRTTPRIGGD